jgi:hypothetical protein
VGDKPHILIKLGGKGVTPSKVDPVVLLELALRYIVALEAVAKETGVKVELHGLKIVRGSAGAQSWTSTPREVATASVSLQEMRARPGENSGAVAKAIGALNDTINHLGLGRWARVLVPGMVDIELQPVNDVERKTFTEQTSRRLRIIGAGGESGGRINVFDYQGEAQFTLTADRDRVVEAGKLMFEDVHALMVVQRDADTLKILGGKLISMEHAARGWTTQGVLEWLDDVFRGAEP